MAELLGQPLMPWQRLVADVGGELIVEDGEILPAYRDVVVTVPRQSGKTTLVLSWMIQRAHGWGKPQRIAYSAQTGNDARKKLVEDWEPLLKPRLAKLGMQRILRGMGNEGIPFRNGSRIVLLASAEESGHGKTVALGVKDELFADRDFRRDQALVPAMSTIDDAQVLTTSTAGTVESLPLNAAVERGRRAVLKDEREGLAYFEWSADEDDGLDDPDTWWSFMPALGYTQSIRSIVAAKETLAAEPGEFRRAFGNLATVTDERIIPAALWDAVTSPTIAPDGRLALAVEVTPDRSSGAIVVSDERGRVEVLEHRQAPGRWLVERTVEFARRHRVPVGIDPSGPAGAFLADLDLSVTLVEIGPRDLGQACGALFDDVMEGRAAFRRHHGLDAAVAGVRKKSVGDAWRWDRRDSAVDVSPLMAATIARWVAMHRPRVDVTLNVW